MIWHAAPVSAASADTAPCLLFAAGSARYVFGAPPNASRALEESALRLTRTRAVFVPRVDVHAAGGLACELSLARARGGC
jgi:hypothetical protein